jgi:hypothetical protein
VKAGEARVQTGFLKQTKLCKWWPSISVNGLCRSKRKTWRNWLGYTRLAEETMLPGADFEILVINYLLIDYKYAVILFYKCIPDHLHAYITTNLKTITWEQPTWSKYTLGLFMKNVEGPGICTSERSFVLNTTK